MYKVANTSVSMEDMKLRLDSGIRKGCVETRGVNNFTYVEGLEKGTSAREVRKVNRTEKGEDGEKTV